MSWISNSFDVDELYYGNPFTIPQQEELPLAQNFFSPLVLDENHLFSVPLAADEFQQANGGGISNMPLPRVNINMSTAQEISANTPTASSKIHQQSSMPNYVSSELKKSTNKGSMARRSGKKDRHTKIKTANGLRDRRMRLSLQIARKFFDLQDKLGFDKASKTIEWLFSKSKKDINQLSSNASHVTEMNNNICQKGSKSVEISEEQRKLKTTSDHGECVSGTKKTPKAATRSTKHNAKDLREQARARARERTREKKMIKCLEKSKWSLSDHANYNLAQLGPAGNPNPLFEIGQESTSNTSSTQDIISTSQSSIHHHLANMELLGATASSSGSVSCSMYGYDHEQNGDLLSVGFDSYSNNLLYLGWDITTSGCLNPNFTGFLESSG